jgi:selenocysteine lyase/cysteine desulfurase
MLGNQKHLFDIPDGVTYLACASQTPLLRASVAAGEIGIARKAHPWGPHRDDAAQEAAEIRALFGGLIGATANDIAIVPATSYGMAIAAANLPVSPTGEIVILEEQFPSNYYAWARLAETNGARLVTVARPPDGDWTAAVLAQLRPETEIAALPPCHWTDGGRLDLAAIGEKCRSLDAALVVDATQYIGAAPFDVATVRPDFMVCSAYKWLLCPYTLAFLYAAPHRQNGDPIEFHAGARRDGPGPNPGEGASAYRMLFMENAQRFDMGERYNLINLPMALAALEQLHEWTPNAIAGTLGRLTGLVADRAAARGFTVPPKAHRVAHFIGFRGAKAPAPDLADRCAADGVHFNLRGNAIRIAPYLFNDEADIERFFAAFDRHHQN